MTLTVCRGKLQELRQGLAMWMLLSLITVDFKDFGMIPENYFPIHSANCDGRGRMAPSKWVQSENTGFYIIITSIIANEHIDRCTVCTSHAFRIKSMFRDEISIWYKVVHEGAQRESEASFNHFATIKACHKITFAGSVVSWLMVCLLWSYLIYYAKELRIKPLSRFIDCTISPIDNQIPWENCAASSSDKMSLESL